MRMPVRRSTAPASKARFLCLYFAKVTPFFLRHCSSSASHSDAPLSGALIYMDGWRNFRPPESEAAAAAAAAAAVKQGKSPSNVEESEENGPVLLQTRVADNVSELKRFAASPDAGATARDRSSRDRSSPLVQSNASLPVCMMMQYRRNGL
jgi:hypothetical protein